MEPRGAAAGGWPVSHHDQPGFSTEPTIISWFTACPACSPGWGAQPLGPDGTESVCQHGADIWLKLSGTTGDRLLIDLERLGAEARARRHEALQSGEGT